MKHHSCLPLLFSSVSLLSTSRSICQCVSLETMKVGKLYFAVRL